MKKKELCKLKPLTWIEIKWNDSENTAGLLLETPTRCKGDMPMSVYHPATSENRSVTHKQIARVIGVADVPERDGTGSDFQKLARVLPSGLKVKVM